MANQPFNGGKMNHIFKPGKGCYEDGFASEAAKRCFEDPESIATLKVHGECCMLVRTPVFQTEKDATNSDSGHVLHEWIFYTRLDTRGKPFPEIHYPVPTQAALGTKITTTTTNEEGTALMQPAVFEKHSYCFVPLAKDCVVGKGGKKHCPGPDTYAAIRAGVSSGALPDPNCEGSSAYLTVEWIGRKHQGNIDCLDVDHAITVHGSTIVEIPERTRAAVEQMARQVAIEGVVFQDRVSGERFKLRFDMLVPDSMFAKNAMQKTSTPESTAIKPIAILPAREV